MNEPDPPTHRAPGTTMREPALVALTPAEAWLLLEMSSPRDRLDAEVIAHLRLLLERCAARDTADAE